MENKNELVLSTNLEKGQIVSTVTDQIEVYNLLNIKGKSQRLSSVEGMRLKVTDLILSGNEYVDEETGEVRTQTKVMLKTEDGKYYHTYSKSILNNVVQLKEIFGLPTMENPWRVIPTTVTGKRNNYLMLELY